MPDAPVAPAAPAAPAPAAPAPAAPAPAPAPAAPAPAAPAPAPAPAAPAPAAPAPTDQWFSGFADPTNRGYVENKGWTGAEDVVKSYVNLEKLRGVPAERLLELPEDLGNAEAMAGVHTRLGRPETAEGYEIPTNLPNVDGQVNDNGEFAKTYSGWAHELGLSKAQAAGLAEKWNAHVAATVTGQQETNTQTSQAAITALKKDWGMAYDKNAQMVNAAANAFGMNGDQLKALRGAMGPAGAMKFLHNIAERMGEDSFESPGGGGFGNAISPDAAKAQIQALKNDNEFVKKYTNGDAEAVATMGRLHQFAYPTEVAPAQQ